MIRFVKEADASIICDIYNHYVTNSSVTFEVDTVSITEMQMRIGAASDQHPWFVYEDDGEIMGYAYASTWKSRCAYRFSVETTVYVPLEQQGKGIGSSLYKQLIDALSNTNCHSLIAGVALPNEASIALHEKLGFEKIGHFKEVGWKFDHWIDVGYWELLL